MPTICDGRSPFHRDKKPAPLGPDGGREKESISSRQSVRSAHHRNDDYSGHDADHADESCPQVNVSTSIPRTHRLFPLKKLRPLSVRASLTLRSRATSSTIWPARSCAQILVLLQRSAVAGHPAAARCGPARQNCRPPSPPDLGAAAAIVLRTIMHVEPCPRIERLLTVGVRGSKGRRIGRPAVGAARRRPCSSLAVASDRLLGGRQCRNRLVERGRRRRLGLDPEPR